MSENKHTPGEWQPIDIFPIRRAAWDGPHYTQSPYGYRDAFLAAKPAGLIFYAFDANILSRTDIEFVAYDMRDNLSGGIGQEIWRGKAIVSAELTHDDVEKAIMREAITQRETELFAAEAVIIQGYADKIRAAISKATGSEE